MEAIKRTKENSELFDKLIAPIIEGRANPKNIVAVENLAGFPMFHSTEIDNADGLPVGGVVMYKKWQDLASEWMEILANDERDALSDCIAEKQAEQQSTGIRL